MTVSFGHELSAVCGRELPSPAHSLFGRSLLLADEAFSALDEVTAGNLRKFVVALAHEINATAILITHQLEEAIEVGDRVIVFGKGAALLDDTKGANWPVSRHAELRRAIQSTLLNYVTDPILTQLS